jgi:hypothetical protein
LRQPWSMMSGRLEPTVSRQEIALAYTLHKMLPCAFHSTDIDLVPLFCPNPSLGFTRSKRISKIVPLGPPFAPGISDLCSLCDSSQALDTMRQEVERGRRVDMQRFGRWVVQRRQVSVRVRWARRDESGRHTGNLNPLRLIACRGSY